MVKVKGSFCSHFHASYPSKCAFLMPQTSCCAVVDVKGSFLEQAWQALRAFLMP